MSRRLFWLVVLISCAHAMVHIYELALPSVELKIAREYSPDDVLAGKEMTGELSNYWRLLFGFGALGAGLLVDRFGADRMLAIYLLGCGAACVAVGYSAGMTSLTAAMIAMGAFASIYHPAGLTLISHETNPDNRTRALGLHGIFGSAGIALAPFLAGSLLEVGFSWQQYYWLLAAPGFLLATFFIARAVRRAPAEHEAKSSESGNVAVSEDHADWTSFAILACIGMLQGFIYAALMTFLPRYLSQWNPDWIQLSDISAGNYQAGMVLAVGCVGQYVSGRFARASRLEAQQAIVAVSNAPCLLWMALAEGQQRFWAAGLFALVHFMHQPLYNSLIAKYTPRRTRSFCYGISFAVTFGMGSFGARFAGNSTDDHFIYGSLAGVAILAGSIGAVLWWRNRK
jgi:FSR family fosmidomycin resistance protein-like MFS transporter